MCGIVGYIGNIEVKSEKAFIDLLNFDVVRGEDSTGVMSMGYNGDVRWYKSLALPPEFILHPKAKHVLAHRAKVMVGHNRAATRGKVNAANAHPFEVDHIIGVHNGTLRNKYQLPDHTQFEVDSENLFHAIAKDGLEATLPKVDGAYTLVWLDTKKGTFNIIRNEERPLWCAVQEDAKAMWFASEPMMMRAAFARRGVKISDAGFQEFATDTHYSWKVKNLQDRLDKPTTKMVYGKPEEKTSVFSGGGYTHNQTHSRGRPALPPVNRTANGNAKDKKPEVNTIFHAHGRKWKRGDRVTFNVLYTEKNNHSVRVVGLAKSAPNQEVIIYVPFSAPLYKFLDDALCEFSAEINSLQWNGGKNGDKNDLSIYLRPNSLEMGELKVQRTSKVTKLYDLKGPDGESITVAQFNAFMEKGCAFCGEQATPLSEAGDVLWLDSFEKGDFVCPGCLKEEDNIQFLKESDELPSDKTTH